MIAIGTRLGPYEIVGRIGAGGMGEVYRARDPRLGREVALKVLPTTFASDRERLQRFEQEARAVGALNHPNILSVYDVGTSDGAPFLVTELLEGVDLRARLLAGPIPPRQAILWMQQAATGLAAAHAKGIIHRDLKPENLFLLPDGRIKILDFGLVKLTRSGSARTEETGPLLPSLTATGTILGTASYMAPEQVREQTTDHRADFFSLGAILYELLTGQKAFPGETPADRISAILHHEPSALPTEIAQSWPGLDDIIRHCLEKRAESRFDSARDLAFALGLILEAGGTAPGGRSEAAAPEFSTPHAAPEPVFRRLTFQDGTIETARFTPDGQTVVYTAAFDGNPSEIFMTRVEYPESRRVGLAEAHLLSVSRSADLAVQIRRDDRGGFIRLGMLARAPLVGGVPREILGEVCYADWAPDGRSLAVIRERDGASRLEYPIGKEIHTAEGWISHARVSRDGRRVAFLDHPIRGASGGRVMVLEPGSAPRAVSTGWGLVWGLAWGPGDEILFGGAKPTGMSGIYSVSPEGSVHAVYSSAGMALVHDISAAGDLLIEESTARMRLEFAHRGEEPRDLSWFDWSLGRGLSADGKTVVFDESGPGFGHGVSTFIRATDGSPAIHLGEGRAQDISPDGAWVVSFRNEDPHTAYLLPTGAGEMVGLPLGKVQCYLAMWAPGGRTLCLAGTEAGARSRLYRYDLDRHSLTPITEEGVGRRLSGISPDGRYVVSDAPDGTFAMYSMDGGESRPLRGIGKSERPAQWTADGKAIYVFERGLAPCRVHRLDVETGARELWATITPRYRNGVEGVNALYLTPDGEKYAFSYSQRLSTLYIARGLR